MNDDTRTVADSEVARHFGSEIPEALTGPILEREALLSGMILRYLGMDRVGRDNKQVQIFQVPDATGTVFMLWGTAQLNGKMKQIRKGSVLMLTYLQQDTEQVHQWRAQPYTGAAASFRNLIGQHPWPAKFATLELLISEAAEVEKARRRDQGDGAPRHDDSHAPANAQFGRPLR